MTSPKEPDILDTARKVLELHRIHGHYSETVHALAAAVVEMSEIIDKLPKTADGVPIVPGMEVWQTVVEPEAWIVRSIRRNEFFDNALMVGLMSGNPGDGCSAQGWQLYSTHEAAVAALAAERGEGKEKT